MFRTQYLQALSWSSIASFYNVPRLMFIFPTRPEFNDYILYLIQLFQLGLGVFTRGHIKFSKFLIWQSFQLATRIDVGRRRNQFIIFVLREKTTGPWLPDQVHPRHQVYKSTGAQTLFPITFRRWIFEVIIAVFRRPPNWKDFGRKKFLMIFSHAALACREMSCSVFKTCCHAELLVSDQKNLLQLTL